MRRYLADLFGGSMTGWPTKLALGLDAVPAFYIHERLDLRGPRRKAYIERRALPNP